MAAVRKLRIYKMLICGLNYQWEWSHLSGRISIQNVKLIISGRGWKANLARGPGGGGDAFWGNPLLKAPMSSSLLKHSLPCWLDGVSCLKTSCRILGRERTSKETQRKQKEKKKNKAQIFFKFWCDDSSIWQCVHRVLIPRRPSSLLSSLVFMLRHCGLFVWMGNCTLSFKG